MQPITRLLQPANYQSSDSDNKTSTDVFSFVAAVGAALARIQRVHSIHLQRHHGPAIPLDVVGFLRGYSVVLGAMHGRPRHLAAR